MSPLAKGPTQLQFLNQNLPQNCKETLPNLYLDGTCWYTPRPFSVLPQDFYPHVPQLNLMG